MTFYASYKLYVALIVDPLFDALEAEIDSLSDEEKRELDQGGDDDNFFIPFPFTTRMVEPQPYRGEDPEWQKFVEISRDKELVQSIRSQWISHEMSCGNELTVLT